MTLAVTNIGPGSSPLLPAVQAQCSLGYDHPFRLWDLENMKGLKMDTSQVLETTNDYTAYKAVVTTDYYEAAEVIYSTLDINNKIEMTNDPNILYNGDKFLQFTSNPIHVDPKPYSVVDSRITWGDGVVEEYVIYFEANNEIDFKSYNEVCPGLSCDTAAMKICLVKYPDEPYSLKTLPSIAGIDT